MLPETTNTVVRRSQIMLDEEPEVPTLSANVAFSQLDRHETTQFDDIESDAEEVYIPHHKGDQFPNVIGYQKYLQIVSSLAQNNTDEREPD